MRAKDAVGRYGEAVAARHLVEAGMSIVSRNWRCPIGEVDIIALDGDALVFCEVKTRSSVAFGTPSEGVTRAKVARLRRLAVHWLATERSDTDFWRDIRFDVVSVLRNSRGAATVNHIRGAF